MKSFSLVGLTNPSDLYGDGLCLSEGIVGKLPPRCNPPMQFTSCAIPLFLSSRKSKTSATLSVPDTEEQIPWGADPFRFSSMAKTTWSDVSYEYSDLLARFRSKAYDKPTQNSESKFCGSNMNLGYFDFHASSRSSGAELMQTDASHESCYPTIYILVSSCKLCMSITRSFGEYAFDSVSLLKVPSHSRLQKPHLLLPYGWQFQFTKSSTKYFGALLE